MQKLLEYLYMYVFSSVQLSSVQFSRSVVSDSLRPHELQHARPPCLSPIPRVHSDSHPSSQWCHSEGDQPWDFFGGNDAEAETPVLWTPHAKSWLIGKDSDAGRDCGQEEKGMTEDEMAGWHHRLDGHESEWTLGIGDGQGGLACSIHGVAKSRTRLGDWTELIKDEKIEIN